MRASASAQTKARIYLCKSASVGKKFSETTTTHIVRSVKTAEKSVKSFTSGIPLVLILRVHALLLLLPLLLQRLLSWSRQTPVNVTLHSSFTDAENASGPPEDYQYSRGVKRAMNTIYLMVERVLRASVEGSCVKKNVDLNDN